MTAVYLCRFSVRIRRITTQKMIYNKQQERNILMQKIHSKRKLLDYMADYLITTLTELKNYESLTEFNEGCLWAFIECLEIVSMWIGFKKYGIKDIEKEFQTN